MMKILNSVTVESKSIKTIMSEQNIPYTTAYRKAKWLLSQSLLVVDRFEITPDGKKSSLVYSTFDQLLSSTNMMVAFSWKQKKMLMP